MTSRRLWRLLWWLMLAAVAVGTAYILWERAAREVAFFARVVIVV